uniref:Intracellular protein transport protein USO1-like n=1 Tax=Saccoglossus kowalevskii TaxID=10224 RepID=A0ABM0LVY6_SACKO|nr:PREDICTED: intracellular protein transport protein USO1-like [Saccoglossus kowalevskii]
MTNPQDINELEEIKQKLAEDGLDGNASNDDKLRHIWRLYTKADNGLQTSLKDVEQLRIQQTQEMQEVENYVEHIRSLSHEREQLTAEFEAENEKLKSENEQLRNELVDGANSEITQMLMQEGLEDVANGTTSEQIAYLLVERARLMDEVDIERKRVDDIEASQGFPDDYRLQETIRKEREAFEEERQNFKMTKESLQRLHDDELNRLKKDHQDQVRQKDKLIMELQNEVQKNNNMLERERKARKVDAEEKIVKQETILTQTASRDYELQHLKDKQIMMEEDKNILNEKIKELSEELQKEKTSRSNQEATLHKLRAVIERNKKVLAESEGSKQILADEKRALEMKLAFLQKDIDGMKDKEKTMVNVQSCEKDINDSLKKEIEDLKTEKEKLKT